MIIELKNIKYSASLSEETNAFTADIYVDGKKVGYTKNAGNGGPTSIIPNPKLLDLFKLAENFCSDMPPVKYTFGEVKMDLEHYVDHLFENWLTQKHVKKEITKMDKLCHNHLVIVNQANFDLFKNGEADLHYSIIKFGVPITDISKKTLSIEIERVKKNNLKPGEVIYNDLDFLKS